MNRLTEKSIDCPYCGESIDILIDSSDAQQQYIEDCQVCCKPITISVYENVSGELEVSVYSEDDVF
ncbi:CPXCG motif-containing cysteine-rich protein [Psychromonas sp. KJ10-10]|uniref:CPXCG motif-containing cysteine-rich protein n=1 Tax=Psychromonas sp. KJ10-10 TaxID=3391823 RepID=UPI0039B36B7F